MKLFIDIASFDQSSLADCFADARAQGYSPQPLWRIPKTLDKAPNLDRLGQTNELSQTQFIDLNGLSPVTAARALDDYLYNRGVSVLWVGHAAAELQGLYALLEQPSFRLDVWPHPGEVALKPSQKERLEIAPQGVPGTKPLLAIVSPYPPQKSGVADYVAQLLPTLSNYYHCVLVIADDLAERVADRFPGETVSASVFLTRTDLHQRVLYQIGNSPGHLYALPLMEKVPGFVTLHDFYLGDALMYQQIIEEKKDALLNALLDSHGMNVLPTLQKESLSYCASRYPCNLSVLKNAMMLGVHADYVVQLAREFYGRMPDKAFVRIPFPKAVRPIINQSQRAHLRHQFGIAQTDFVVSTFGFGTPTKCHDVLIQAWVESIFARDPAAHLLIVGDYANTQLLANMQSLSEGLADNIRFVGFVDEHAYLDYLDITDLAVQLRVNSRGETSAAVMDCLASGIPVIANDHGTLSEMPDDILWKIPDPPQVAQLLTALEYLHSRPILRASLSKRARDYLASHHTLEASAEAYYQAIEMSGVASPVAKEMQLIAVAKNMGVTQDEARMLAEAIVFNRPSLGRKQLLVDISEVAKHDLRTGIQRVVRSILAELLKDPPANYDICPVYLDPHQIYRHARQFMLQQYEIAHDITRDEPVKVRAGDRYLGIDLHPTATADAAHIYKNWRAHGVHTSFVLYDLLPIHHPEWFPPIVLPEFTRWLHTIAAHGDQIIAISKTVADEMQAWLDQQEITQMQQPAVRWFHLGADIRASLPTGGLPEDALLVLDAIGSSPSFLMVATVEPRKGHAQALAAFDDLWARGVEVNLVIVGKRGWMVDVLAERILAHPALGKRLFWLQGISDEYLEAVYPRCAALLAASEGEGFGLPIIEAAQHQLPVIARDIPVFREVGGEGISYFTADRPEQLADYLQTWIKVPSEKRPEISRVQWQTWRESAQQIGRCL